MALVFFAMSLSSHAADLSPGLLHGLKLVAVAVVAQAVWGMAKVLCVGVPRVTLMTIACCVALWLPSALGQIGVIVMAGLAGLVLFKPDLIQNHDPLPITVSRRAGAVWLALFFLLLMGLPVWAAATSWQVMADINVFFRSGALVFGGGHVVLPLLQEAVVSPGWVSNDAFLAGYGAAQAVPGPLFTFAAFLGASMNTGPTGWLGGLVCLLAIFAPSLFLVAGTVPFWELLRRNRRTQAALMGVNAAVVGLLLAALYQPVWKSAVNTPQDFGMAVMAFVALVYWRLPPWLVVIASGVAGWMAS
jgi:chromate transporter